MIFFKKKKDNLKKKPSIILKYESVVSKAWYYAEVLKNARKSAGMTQQELADKIGKKREYIASLEKCETD